MLRMQIAENKQRIDVSNGFSIYLCKLNGEVTTQADWDRLAAIIVEAVNAAESGKLATDGTLVP